jgi:hypothetical protein
MLVISASYQNYQNGIVGNQLMDVRGGGGVEVRVCGDTDSESVDLLRV